MRLMQYRYAHLLCIAVAQRDESQILLRSSEVISGVTVDFDRLPSQDLLQSYLIHAQGFLKR